MGKLSQMQLNRRAVIEGLFNQETEALEVGAYCMPTFLEGEIKTFEVADYYSTKDLKKQAQKSGLNPEDVAEVSYVLSDGGLSDALGKRQYDIIVAHHVVEHLIDPFRWMKDLEKHLKPDGFLFITLPDKKYSFDRFRSDTPLAHFITDFLDGGEASVREHLIETHILNDRGYTNKSNLDKDRLSRKKIKESADKWSPGFHMHVFQYETFADTVLRPFLSFGYLNYQLTEYMLTRDYGEFHFLLQKTEANSYGDLDIFKNAVDTYENFENEENNYARMHPRLIFDLGLGSGEDTQYYLKRGFSVVAVDGNKEACSTASDWLEGHSEKLTILNKVLAENGDEEIEYFISSTLPDISGTEEWRVQQVGDYRSETVGTITLEQLYSNYGIPHYVKVDLSGNNEVFCDQLVTSRHKPYFVSVEGLTSQWLAKLAAAGYDRFQFVNQAIFRRFPTDAELKSDYGDFSYQFFGNCSGPFGYDLPKQDWMTFDVAMESWLRLQRLKETNPNFTLDNWFDFHATTNVVLMREYM